METQRNIVFYSERVVLHKNTRRPRPATKGIVTNFADLNIDIPEDSEDAIHQECLRQIGLPMTIDDSDLVPILPTLSQFSKVQIFRESPPCKRAASDQSNVEEPTQGFVAERPHHPNTETNQTNNDQNSVVDNNLDEHNESVTTEGDQKSSSSEDDKKNESWSEKSDDTHDDISVSSSVLSDDDEKTSSDNESNSESSREKSYDTDVLLASPDPNGRDEADDDNEAPVISDDDDDVEIIEHKVEVIEVNDSEEPGTSNQKPLSIKPKIRKKRTDNENTTFKNKAKTITITMADLEKEEEDDDTEMRVAETFEEYKPRKVKYKHSHPDIVVETASLASVEPVDVTYELSLPQNVIDEGLLSAVQLEAVVYASQAHEIYLPDKSRAGFFIGDGAGVGKGRTVAGIIYENYQKGRKCALWFSVSGDLKVDAERDLRDIGASCIKTYNITDMSYDDHISSPVNGNVTEGVIFSTYTSLISNTKEQKKYKSRIEQLLQWCGDNFDGVIIFDECHKAKNLYSGRNSSQTGLCVQELQTKLEKARVVYASATGASEPRDMAYMSRLGLWGKGTPFPYFGDFLDAVEKRGVSAMELVAMDMKQRGVYIARQLSFRGVDVAIKEVPMSDEFKKVYDDSTKLWDDARQTLLAAIEALKFDGKKARSLWSQFWSAHQRFFKYLCVSAKTEAAAQEARRAVAEGKCVVIGLQTTGEARTIQLLSTNQHTTHFVSIAKETFRGLVIKFPTSPNDFIDENAADDQPGDKRKLTPEPSGVEAKRPRVCPHSGPEYRDRPCDCKEQLQQDTDLEYDSVKKMKRELLEAIEELGPRLPPNPLDELIWRLGGTDKVAEMTGRVLRGVKGTEGKVRHERRAGGQGKKKDINLEEKDLFMDGVKTIAIISEAASSGISLQSDRRVKNKMRRVHITLELPWSADQAVQQFGRTHRSNQVNAPEYILLISDLAGERRFASTVAKRLESLGALTHGDRRATDTRDLSQFNINNKYGGLALSKVMNAIHQTESEDEVLVKLPTDYEGNFINDVTYTLQQVQFCEEKNYRDTTMFLNRILGIPVKVQNRLFKYFADTLEAVIQVAKRNGTLELGILELDTRGTRDNIQYVGCESFPCSHATGTASVKLHTLLYQPCMDWTNAEKIYLQNREPSVNGFYKPKGPRKVGSDVMLCISEQVKGDPSELVRVYRPSTGRSPKLQLIDGIKTNETAKVKQIWETLYKASLVSCKHQKCDFKCLNGKNARIFYILSGSVLSVWKQVEHVLCGYRQRSAASFMKLVRLNTDDNKFIGLCRRATTSPGILIPVRRITMLREVLAKDPQELLDMIDDRRNVPFRSLTIEKTTLEDGKATDAAIDLSLTKTPTMLDIPKKTEIKRFYDDIEDLEFLTKYRMTKNTVLQLLNSIQLYDRTVKLPIERQLLIALRYYATGDTFTSLSTIYDVSAKTVKEVIQLISEVIVKNLKHIFIKMPTKNEMDNHKEEFYRIAKFPNVIGCIDCTHVKIKMPEFEGQLYQNSRGWFSLNVQLVSDARLRIRNAVGNSYGSSKDADILFESNMFRKYLLKLDNSSFLLGDNAYPVMKNLLTPIANPENISEANYNKSLIDTRTNTIGKLIDRLKRRFPVLAKGLKLDLQTSIYVINACCILHNICLDNNETMPPEEVHAENLHELISKGQIDNCYGGKQFKDDDFSRSIIISKYFTKK